MHGATAELFTQARIDRLRESSPGTRLVTCDRDVIQLRIDDAPLDEVVHQHVFLLGRDEALGLCGVHGQDALVEIAHVLNQGQLEVQAWIRNDLFDLTKLEHDCILALIDGKQRRRGDDHGEHQSPAK